MRMTFPEHRYCTPREISLLAPTHTIGFITQAMLYAAGVPSRDAMKTQPHVGIASVWWEGNPCK